MTTKPIDLKTQLATLKVEFGISKAEIAKLHARFDPLDASTPEGYQKVKAAILEVKRIRIDRIDKREAATKKPLNDVRAKILKAAKEAREPLLDLESELKEKLRQVDEKARIEKERREQEALEKLEAERVAEAAAKDKEITALKAKVAEQERVSRRFEQAKVAEQAKVTPVVLQDSPSFPDGEPFVSSLPDDHHMLQRISRQLEAIATQAVSYHNQWAKDRHSKCMTAVLDAARTLVDVPDDSPPIDQVKFEQEVADLLAKAGDVDELDSIADDLRRGTPSQQPVIDDMYNLAKQSLIDMCDTPIF